MKLLKKLVITAAAGTLALVAVRKARTEKGRTALKQTGRKAKSVGGATATAAKTSATKAATAYRQRRAA